MPELFATGSQRLAYRSTGYASGVTVSMDVFKPDGTWDYNNTFIGIASGLYYLDYNFPTTGAYIANFYEDESQSAAQTYRVATITATGGSGASAADIWAYVNRTLTAGATSEVTDYISSQITWVSSQLEGLSSQIELYGGGGGGTRYVLGGGSRKSPWTHRQKEFVVEAIEKITDTLETIDRKIDHSDEENKSRSDEIKEISNTNLKEIESTRDKLQNIISDKKVQDKSINNINEKLMALNSQIEDVKNDVNDKDDLKNLSNQIDGLCDLLAGSLSDMELEELLEKYSK